MKPITHLMSSIPWHSAYMVTSGTLVNRARQKASGMEHTQIKPESKKNVITVLPPERSV